MVTKNARSEDTDITQQSKKQSTTSSSTLPLNQQQDQQLSLQDQQMAKDGIEYEDAYEDIEQDIEDPFDVTVDALNSDSNSDNEEITVLDKEDTDDDESPLRTYLPGQTIDENQVLVPDNSAYECLHALSVEWPCLSFDILKDGLGDNRSTFPHSAMVVTGTQAEHQKDNRIYILKMTHLHKTKHDDQDEDDEDAMSQDSDNDTEESAVLECKKIIHQGGVNRIRAMPNTPLNIISTFSDSGRVNIYDITAHVQSFDTHQQVSESLLPVHVNKLHKSEGYGLDWSPTIQGRLLSGDIDGTLLLTESNGAQFVSDKNGFKGHVDSVEDIQWSPSQRDVFVSCSADQTVKVWDCRAGRKAQMSIKAHTTDVNVLSWNRSVEHLLASGADDGVFSVWDLRNWVNSDGTHNKQPTPAATFKWHQKPITSIQWHPTESSMLAVSGDDDQITIWDLALEADDEEEMERNEFGVVVPPQLLFIHQGQQSVKEIQFHRQIPGLIMSTALTGFHVFKTINS